MVTLDHTLGHTHGWWVGGARCNQGSIYLGRIDISACASGTGKFWGVGRGGRECSLTLIMQQDQRGETGAERWKGWVAKWSEVKG